MKPKLAVLLLFAAVLTCAVSCQDPAEMQGTTSDTATASITGTDALETDAESVLLDNLPETDMDGYVFKIFNCNDGGNYALHVDEANGEIIGDAIYERNLRIEERFNMTFENIEYGSYTELWGTATARMRSDILGGSTEYNVMRMRIPDSVTFFYRGLYLRL